MESFFGGGAMKKIIKKLIRLIVYGHAADSDTFVKFLKTKKCHIGKRVIFYDPPTTTVDITRPWLVSIGDDVKITRGVTILTHGYDWSVLQGAYGEILGSSGGVNIGNNVFVGMNATILKGVNIGNNVIIGAGSLVNKDIPDNVVVAGVPAKVISTLEEYYNKRKAAQITEVTELITSYKNQYGCFPNDEVLHEFFWLFEDNPSNLPICWKAMMRLHDNELICNENMKKHTKSFQSKEELFEYVNKVNS